MVSTSSSFLVCEKRKLGAEKRKAKKEQEEENEEKMEEEFVVERHKVDIGPQVRNVVRLDI